MGSRSSNNAGEDGAVWLQAVTPPAPEGPLPATAPGGWVCCTALRNETLSRGRPPAGDGPCRRSPEPREAPAAAPCTWGTAFQGRRSLESTSLIVHRRLSTKLLPEREQSGVQRVWEIRTCGLPCRGWEPVSRASLLTKVITGKQLPRFPKCASDFGGRRS